MSGNTNERILCCRKAQTGIKLENCRNENVNIPLNCCHNKKVNQVCQSIGHLNLIFFMLLFGFSLSVRKLYRDNLIYRQLCIERLKSDYLFCYTVREVHNITEKDMMVLEVTRTSSSYVFAIIGLKAFVELFSATLLCSWSDMCGRKLPLLIALLGESFDLPSILLQNIPFTYFILSFFILTALSALFGGYVCIHAMAYCFLTDHCPESKRALSFTFIDFTYMAGIICGVVGFKNFTEGDILLISWTLFLVTRSVLVLWILVTFADREFDLSNATLAKKFGSLLSISLMKEPFKAISRSRLNLRTTQIIFLIISAVPVVISYSYVDGVIITSTIHARLFSSYEDYKHITLYFALYSCFAGPIAIVIYQSLSKFKDATLGCVGLSNLYLNFFIGGFAHDHLTFLMGLGLAPVKCFAIVGLRSAYSRIPEEDERGKIFYFYTCAERIAIFLGYLTYEKVRFLLTERDDILPHMMMCFALILPLCAFTFQLMSIHTSHLFEACYSNVNFAARDPQPAS